jgi:signal transduction histidine kinase
MPQPHAPPPPDAPPAALVRVDAGGRVTAWDAGAEAWTGIPAAAAIGRPADDVLPGADAWGPALRDALDGGPGGSATAVRDGAGGRWADVSALPAPGGALLVVVDVTAHLRRAADAEALRDAALALSATLAPAGVSDALCARARSLLGADFAAVEIPMLGQDPCWSGDAEAYAAFRERHPEVAAQVAATGRPAAVGMAGAAAGWLALPSTPEEGAAIVVSVQPDGAPAGAMVAGWRRGPVPPRAPALAEALAVQAATAFRNAGVHAAVQEAAVRRDRFFSAMSHDLRTPITAIVGYSELLQDGIVGELAHAQQEMVERISQVAGHLSQLVNDILDLAKLDAGRMEFHREAVRLGDLIDQSVVAVEPQTAAKGLSLRLDVDALRSDVLRVDPPRVRQVLVNLLSNAVKFTERGVVTVRAGVDGDRRWISVADTGPGLPPGAEEAVFEEFLQFASGTRTKREPGSGLGLAISRRLARAMGGDLTARSQPGHGSVFTLSLPHVPEAADDA